MECGVGALQVWGCLVGFVASFGVLLTRRYILRAHRCLTFQSVLYCVLAPSGFKYFVLSSQGLGSQAASYLESRPVCKHTPCFLSSLFF